MTDRELMQQALEALSDYRKPLSKRTTEDEEASDRAIDALRDRLAQPEQEPVALETVYETIIQWDEGGGKRSRRELARRIVSLYTTPPQRPWVGLTDAELAEFSDAMLGSYDLCLEVEANLRSKNT